tara:strand:- start:306 stop:437 length:132 start_codon:yes stop_codon:yes gene_type:complete
MARSLRNVLAVLGPPLPGQRAGLGEAPALLLALTADSTDRVLA